MKKYKNILMTGLLAVFLVFCMGQDGCERKVAETGESTKAEMSITERSHLRLQKAVPPPELQTSAERVNLKRKLEEWNNENKISYIYLVSYGRVMAYHTVKGKVSSLNSKLTTSQQLVNDGHGYTSGRNYIHVMESPSLDGSYGPNPNGVFFWTTEGIYVEWNDTYLLSTEPLKLTAEPVLIRMIEDKPSEQQEEASQFE